jgi:membrane protein
MATARVHPTAVPPAPAAAPRGERAQAPPAPPQGVRGYARQAWSVLRQTYAEWSEDNAARLAAALTFYTLFSLAPLLVLAIGVAGLFLGSEAVRGQLMHQFAGLVGPDGAEAIEDLIANARRPGESVVASAVGFVLLLLGASGVVGELKASLNQIWDLPAPPSGFFAMVRQRLLSFALVLGIGFVLLVSLLISASLAAASDYLHGGEVVAGIWIAVNLLVTLGVETALFTAMFKLLPDTPIRWRDVWIGALCTAVLFELGKLLVGLYLGRAGLASAYGAAGSLVIVLLWIYYSAQILFFGAELTQVMARRRDAAAAPAPPPA